MYTDTGSSSFNDVVILPTSGSATSLAALVSYNVFASDSHTALPAQRRLSSRLRHSALCVVAHRVSVRPLCRTHDSVAIPNDGPVFVACEGPNAVYAFSMTGKLLATLVYSSQFLKVTGLAFDPALNRLYGADQGNTRSSASRPPRSLPSTGRSAPFCRACRATWTTPGERCAPRYQQSPLLPPGQALAAAEEVELFSTFPQAALTVAAAVLCLCATRSVASSLQFQYLPSPVLNSYGQAVQLVIGMGVRTFTNRFGISFASAIGLGVSNTASNLLYVNAFSPVDGQGILYGLSGPVQVPAMCPTELYNSPSLYNATNTGYIAETADARLDNFGSAFLSSVPGFLNVTVGASNINAFAVNYAACKAPLTFTNGLRSPTQPSTSNGAVRSLFRTSSATGCGTA